MPHLQRKVTNTYTTILALKLLYAFISMTLRVKFIRSLCPRKLDFSIEMFAEFSLL